MYFTDLEEPEWLDQYYGDSWYLSGGQVYLNDQLFEPGPCPKCGGPMGFRREPYNGPVFSCYDYPYCTGTSWLR